MRTQNILKCRSKFFWIWKIPAILGSLNAKYFLIWESSLNPYMQSITLYLFMMTVKSNANLVRFLTEVFAWLALKKWENLYVRWELQACHFKKLICWESCCWKVKDSLMNLYNFFIFESFKQWKNFIDLFRWKSLLIYDDCWTLLFYFLATASCFNFYLEDHHFQIFHQLKPLKHQLLIFDLLTRSLSANFQNETF